MTNTTNEVPELRCSSVGKAILYSPKRYRAYCDSERSSSRSSARGTLCHAMMLGGAQVQLIDFADKKTKAAKCQWAEAEAAGLTPALRSDYLIASEAAAVGRQRMEDRFGAGVIERASTRHEAELSLECVDDSGRAVLLTGHPDTLVVDCEAKSVSIVEVKTTADISKFAELIYSADYDGQAAGYRALVRAIPDFTDYHVDHSFLVLECQEPYCSAWVMPDGMSEYIGDRKLAMALDRVATGHADGWPDYPTIHASPRQYQVELWK